MNKLIIVIINFYRRFISPMKAPSCRFYPTCSQYALEAFQKYSFIKAVYLSVKRILKCQPFNSGGYDPLP